jgi:hypothetical protein
MCKMKQWALCLLFLFAAAFASAQTTYNMPTSYFVCDSASRYPVNSFSQFSCRGVKLALNNAVVGSFFLFSTSEVEVALPNIPYPPDVFESYVTNLDSFTNPYTDVNGKLQPGTLKFEWQEEDANGDFHTGTASGTWVNQQICGGRGCQYYAPKLPTFSTTAN